MTGLQSFYEQEPRIENKDCKEKTSEGKDKIIIGLFRKNFEQNLTRSDEDLVNNLVDLGKKNIVLNIDINEGLNVFDVDDNFLNMFRQKYTKIKLLCLMISQCLKKIQRPKVQLEKMVF